MKAENSMKTFLDEESAKVSDELHRNPGLRERLTKARGPRRTSKAPPQDTGERERLATFPRDNGELRIGWNEYEGHPYLSLRIWTPDDAGTGWWPSKAGVTVKVRELEDFAQAVARALDLLDEGTRTKV